MTYGEFKERLRYHLVGGMALSKNDSAVLSFYKQAEKDVLSTTEPLALITSDLERYQPYRWLDDRYFIRYPKDPIESKELDMDEKLQDAILDLVCSFMSQRDDRQRVSTFLVSGEVKKDDYRQEVYKYVQDDRYYSWGTRATYSPTCNRPDIPLALEQFGYLKYYRVIKNVLDNSWWYKWQWRVVELIDRFMLVEDGRVLTPSHLALWNQFVAYEDNVEPELWQEERKAIKKFDRIMLRRSGFWQIDPFL